MRGPDHADPGRARRFGIAYEVVCTWLDQHLLWLRVGPRVNVNGNWMAGGIIELDSWKTPEKTGGTTVIAKPDRAHQLAAGHRAAAIRDASPTAVAGR